MPVKFNAYAAILPKYGNTVADWLQKRDFNKGKKKKKKNKGMPSGHAKWTWKTESQTSADASEDPSARISADPPAINPGL